MAERKFQLSLTIVELLLFAFGTLEYVMATTTASNVAFAKPSTQTDTAGGANAMLAVDGDTSTCSETASAQGEWTLDLRDYCTIEEVSIHTETVSQWVASVVNGSDGNNNRIIGPNDGVYREINWIEVEFAKKVKASKIDIYEEIIHTRSLVRVEQIKCYVDGGWETVWNAPSTSVEEGARIFSPPLTKSCFSNRFRLETEGRYMHIDAVMLHGSLYESYKIEMGLSQGLYETEGITYLSTLSPAKWIPSNNGPYSYARIQANPQTETLKLCEVLVKGHIQLRTPYFRLVTGIAMSNHPISTVFNVLSNIECVFVCLRQTEPACLTSQFDKAANFSADSSTSRTLVMTTKQMCTNLLHTFFANKN